MKRSLKDSLALAGGPAVNSDKVREAPSVTEPSA
jgi:hypothetical protein